MLSRRPRASLRGRFFSRKLPALALFPLMLLVCFVTEAYGDSIRLVSGRVLEGKIVNQTRKYVLIRVGGRVRRVSKRNIDTIQYGRTRKRKRRKKKVSPPKTSIPKATAKKTAAVIRPDARAKPRPPGKSKTAVENSDASIWSAFPGALVPGWSRYAGGYSMRGGLLAGAHLALGAIAINENNARLAATSELRTTETTALASLTIPSQAIAVNLISRIRAEDQRAVIRSRAARVNAATILLLLLYSYNIWDAVNLSAPARLGVRVRERERGLARIEASPGRPLEWGRSGPVFRFAYRISL